MPLQRHISLLKFVMLGELKCDREPGWDQPGCLTKPANNKFVSGNPAEDFYKMTATLQVYFRAFIFSFQKKISRKHVFEW